MLIVLKAIQKFVVPMNRLERSPSWQKPYLWVLGEGIEMLPIGERVDQRFEVIAPQVWLDTQPELPPPAPDLLPLQVRPYLQAHAHRLHLPGLYGILEGTGRAPILLLENGPLHPQSGTLYPSLETAWLGARPLRQIYWLWQLWELWPILTQLGVAASLLSPETVRVEGWRVRLRELVAAGAGEPSLSALAELWDQLLPAAQTPLIEPLRQINAALRAVSADDSEAIAAIAQSLNQLLLSQAAQVSVRLAVAGASSAGPRQVRNEDACYPNGNQLVAAPYLGIVCDGVGGHSSGEVASQMAVQSLQLQLRGLLTEAQSEAEVLAPELVQQQIAAVIRVVNDVINHQNDQQSRAERQRMGTTLALAVVVPQRVHSEQGWVQVNELYIAHVGDSRAYWITPDYCHLLTVDHDIAAREVMAARQLWGTARNLPDGSALTQAVGTRSADYLNPVIQRFILEESGIVLLCSDGLSDHQRVEQAWANYIGLIVKDIVSLEAAVASWIELANQKNGHDNAAVVLMQVKAILKSPTALSTEVDDPARSPESELTAASRALLYGETAAELDRELAEPASDRGSRRRLPIWIWLVALSIVIAGGLSLLTMLRPPAGSDPAPEVPAQPNP